MTGKLEKPKRAKGGELKGRGPAPDTQWPWVQEQTRADQSLHALEKRLWGQRKGFRTLPSAMKVLEYKDPE